MKNKIKIDNPASTRKQTIFWGAFIILTVVSFFKLDIDWEQVQIGLKKVPNIAGQMLSFSTKALPDVVESLVLTLAIAVLGLAISVCFAFVFGFLMAENSAPNKVVKAAISGICTVIRAIPTTVWVLLAVASAGFGSTSAVLGLALPTVAYLSKTFANQIESCGPDLKETQTALGTLWPVRVVRGFFPMCSTSLLAQTAFRLEMSVSESTVLGLVGCGGIGYMVSKYIKTYKFPELTTSLVVILVTMFALEMCTSHIRKKMRKNENE